MYPITREIFISRGLIDWESIKERLRTGERNFTRYWVTGYSPRVIEYPVLAEIVIVANVLSFRKVNKNLGLRERRFCGQRERDKKRERECGTRRGPRSRELVRVLVKLVEHKAREVSDFRSECFDRFMTGTRNLEFLNFRKNVTLLLSVVLYIFC